MFKCQTTNLPIYNLLPYTQDHDISDSRHLFWYQQHSCKSKLPVSALTWVGHWVLNTMSDGCNVNSVTCVLLTQTATAAIFATWLMCSSLPLNGAINYNSLQKFLGSTGSEGFLIRTWYYYSCADGLRSHTICSLLYRRPSAPPLRSMTSDVCILVCYPDWADLWCKHLVLGMGRSDNHQQTLKMLHNNNQQQLRVFLSMINVNYDSPRKPNKTFYIFPWFYRHTAKAQKT